MNHSAGFWKKKKVFSITGTWT